MNVNMDDITHYLTTGGAIVVMAFIILAFLRGWIVPGHSYEDLLQDRDDWKEIALTSAGAADKAVDLAERRRNDNNRGIGARQGRGNHAP